MSATVGSICPWSLEFAGAVRMTSGNPFESTTRVCFVPSFLQSTGLSPVASPPKARTMTLRRSPTRLQGCRFSGAVCEGACGDRPRRHLRSIVEVGGERCDPNNQVRVARPPIGIRLPAHTR